MPDATSEAQPDVATIPQKPAKKKPARSPTSAERHTLAASEVHPADAGLMSRDQITEHARQFGFQASPSHLEYAYQYLAAEPGSSAAQIAAACGQDASLIRQWWACTRGFNDWMGALLLHACKRGLPAMWSGLLKRADAGDMRAAHMIALRFDPRYRQPQQAPEDTPEMEAVAQTADTMLASKGKGQGDHLPAKQGVPPGAPNPKPPSVWAPQLGKGFPTPGGEA
jgi:hypothetical protein